MDVAKINTTLELQRPAWGRWRTKDERVSFQKREEGWTAFSFSDPVHKAFEEYGIGYAYTHFLSLKAVRQAVNDVSLEAGLNIDLGLTRGKYVSYKIGDLPLSIKRQQGHWRVCAISSALSPILEKYFNSTQEFQDVWESTDIALVHYPTRKAAHQAVLNWLAQTITEAKQA